MSWLWSEGGGCSPTDDVGGYPAPAVVTGTVCFGTVPVQVGTTKLGMVLGRVTLWAASRRRAAPPSSSSCSESDIVHKRIHGDSLSAGAGLGTG